MFMKPRIKMLYAPNTCVCDMCLRFASEKRKISIKQGRVLCRWGCQMRYIPGQNGVTFTRLTCLVPKSNTRQNFKTHKYLWFSKNKK